MANILFLDNFDSFTYNLPIDQNVWGRAIETGFLEDPWNGPTKDCYSYTTS